MIADIFRMNDHMCILCNRRNHRDNITLLNAHASKRKPACRDGCRISRLSGKNQHRNGIHPAAQDACDGICCPGSCRHTDSSHTVIHPCVCLRCHRTRLLMMLIGTVKLRMMTEGIIHMHGTAAGHCKHIPDSPLCNILSYIIRYFLFHYACFLPSHLFSHTINLPEAWIGI